MKKTWLPLLLLVVLSSCYLPPYREELSLALTVTQKMDGVAFVGPLDYYSGEFEDWDIKFLPSKDAIRIRSYPDPDNSLALVRGFMVANNDRRVRVQFINHDGNEYNINYGNWAEYPIGITDENQFRFRATTIIDGSDDIIDSEQLGVIVFDNSADPPNREYIILDENLNPTNFPMDTAELLLGAGFFHDFTDIEKLHTLRIDELSDTYLEVEYNVDPGALNPIPPAGPFRGGPLPGLPKDINNCFYYRLPAPPSPTRRAYLSVYDQVRREYRNFSWDDGYELQVISKMKRRIDLVLSNGWLYSRDENKGYIYSGTGELINSFVLGGLSLVYEIFDGGIHRSVFTIPVWAPQNVGSGDWDDKLFFLVYWIPTDKLADL